MFENIYENVQQIKKRKPLILNITNDVTMDFVANGLLSIGASPIMSQSEIELSQLIAMVDVVVINIGTLNEDFNSLCYKTCDIANQLKKPIVLDPVGSGATTYRTQTALQLLNHYSITILRGNASEIASLVNHDAKTKGVDSSMTTDAALHSAKMIATQFNTVVAMSGARDVIVDQARMQSFTRGSSLMPFITGTGCLLTAVTAAFHAVEKDAWLSACHAHLFYSIAGEIAAEKTQTPGSFRQYFLDALFLLPEKKHYENQFMCADHCRH